MRAFAAAATVIAISALGTFFWSGQKSFHPQFILGLLSGCASLVCGHRLLQQPRSESETSARLKSAIETQQNETARVHLLLDVVTVANISESFAEASQSIADLLTIRFPIQSVDIWSKPEEAQSLILVAQSHSKELHPNALDHQLRRTYPVRAGAEKVGELRISGKIFRDLDADMHHVFLGIASHIAQVALRERSSSLQQIAARTDELTDLPNRRGFRYLLDEQIERAEALGKKFAVLYVDLNGFKGVNDTFGHEAGDQVLQEMSRRLSQAVRLSDAVARTSQSDQPCRAVSRLGGDEFSVILDDVHDIQGAEIVAKRIITTTSKPIPIESHSVEIGAAVGIALYPDDATTRSELLQCADIAMYAAKAAPGNHYERYSQKEHERSSTFLLAQDLRRALEEDALEFYLQPVFDARSGALVAAEALARWNHPELGWVPPDRFIQVAESSGLIKSLGRFILNGSHQWLSDHAADLPENFRISVNVSAHQLEDPEFSHEVAELIAQSELSPSQLELEVTETVLLNDRPGVWMHIRALASIGVSFALDDFGTGYSSLSLLKKLPIARIKIDQSFVSGLPSSPEDVAIVDAILSMARSMSLPTLAEGVETEEQFDFLAEKGCEEIQGYLMGRPGSPSQILQIHANRKAGS